MSGLIFDKDDTSKSIDIEVYNDEGQPTTGLVAATFPALTYSKAGANADVSITLADLATITTAWASGGLKERGNGIYRLDVPDSVFGVSNTKVTIKGGSSGKWVIPKTLEVSPQLPNTTVGTATTVTTVAAISLPAATIASALDGTDISIQRGDTVTIAITGLGSLTSRTGEKLWFTVKAQVSDADTAATIQVSETTGAIRLNGAATTASYASIVVTDAATGAITITLKPALTAALVRGEYHYDIQILETAVVRTLSSGTATVVADVTRAIT